MTEVTGHIKDLTQEQLDGRDAKDRVWGKEMGFPCPLTGHHCPLAPRLTNLEAL